MTMASTTAPTCGVGERVAAGKEGHIGTVRYVGAVEGQDEKQLWVGIEWDDPSRGKQLASSRTWPRAAPLLCSALSCKCTVQQRLDASSSCVLM